MNDGVTILTFATGKYITEAFRGSDYQSVQFNPDLELSKEAIKSLYRRSKANEPKTFMTMFPDLVRTATQIATFKAGAKRI